MNKSLLRLLKTVAAFVFFQSITSVNSSANSAFGPHIRCAPTLQSTAASLIPVDATQTPNIHPTSVSLFLSDGSPSSREYDFQDSRARVSLTLNFTPEHNEPNVLGTLSIAKTFFERNGDEVALMMAFYSPTRLKVRRSNTGLELSATATSQGSPRLRLMINESVGHHPAFTLTCEVSE